MDSLLANYASSDDDDREEEEDGDGEQQRSAAAASPRLPPPKPSSIFSSSLPPPRSSSSLFSSLPPPLSPSSDRPSAASVSESGRLGEADGEEKFGIFKARSSLFSSLPPPKRSFSSSSFPKSGNPGEEDDEDAEKGGISTAFGAKHSLSSALPPPLSLSSDRPRAASVSASGRLGEADGEEKCGIFKARRSLFSSLPPPKRSSSSSSFPKSGNLGEEDGEDAEKGGISTAFGAKHSLFSALPPPKGSSSSSLLSHVRLSKTADSASSDRNPSVLKNRDLDDDEEDEERKTIKGSSDAANASSSISSILPAPKNIFRLSSSAASASSRRSIVDADVPAADSGGFTSAQGDSALGYSGGYDVDNNGLVGAPPEAGVDGAKDVDYLGIGTNISWDQSVVEGTVYPGYEAYSGYDDSSAASYWDPGYAGAANYGNHEGNWSDGGTAAVASEIPDIGRIAGKRGRNDAPAEIMEVKQDELMKNRPRQDQTKLTGIAFGPSHQPASSAKGKPSKLHKRKHQIGSLYFDMRQNELELKERRAQGLLTKAETQAKYGW